MLKMETLNINMDTVQEIADMLFKQAGTIHSVPTLVDLCGKENTAMRISYDLVLKGAVKLKLQQRECSEPVSNEEDKYGYVYLHDEASDTKHILFLLCTPLMEQFVRLKPFLCAEQKEFFIAWIGSIGEMFRRAENDVLFDGSDNLDLWFSIQRPTIDIQNPFAGMLETRNEALEMEREQEHLLRVRLDASQM